MRPSGTPISVIGATVTKTETDQEYIFDVELEQPHDNCNVYVAIYDENHCLIAVRIASLDTTKKASVPIDKLENEHIAKIFIWTDKLEPIIDSVTIEL